MEDIKVGDQVLIVVKRNELVAKVVKIEDEVASCSFFMPRSKGMFVMKFPIKELKLALSNDSDPKSSLL